MPAPAPAPAQIALKSGTYHLLKRNEEYKDSTLRHAEKSEVAFSQVLFSGGSSSCQGARRHITMCSRVLFGDPFSVLDYAPRHMHNGLIQAQS